MVIVINSGLVDLDEWTWYDWLLQLYDYRCSITANCPITLSDYNCTEWLVKNEAADVPIVIEEMVMVMINVVKSFWASFDQLLDSLLKVSLVARVKRLPGQRIASGWR